MSLRINADNFSLKEPKETVERILRFLRDYLDKSDTSKLVLGMSGGLDSSVTAALCAEAAGGKNVLGIYMPEDETRNNSASEDATAIANTFHINLKTINITKILTAATSTIPIKDRARNLVPHGNVKARVRSMILYYFANIEHRIVVGTGDKSEIMLGYFTKYGDGACDILPIADFYKTTVRALAKYLRLPKRVYSKPASPELWPGQTATGELGLGYDRLDEILWGLERLMSDEDIAEQTDLPLQAVRGVRARWTGSEHKRRTPLVLKSGLRTAGADMRLPL